MSRIAKASWIIAIVSGITIALFALLAGAYWFLVWASESLAEGEWGAVLLVTLCITFIVAIVIGAITDENV